MSACRISCTPALAGSTASTSTATSFRIAPVTISGHDLAVLADWMVLVYTGVKRHASAIVAEQLRNTAQGSLDSELREMLGLVDAAQQILEDAGRRADAPARIGGLLHQSWQVKKTPVLASHRAGDR